VGIETSSGRTVEQRAAPTGTETPSEPQPLSKPSRAPAYALIAVVVAAAGLYAGAAQLVGAPRVHPDELIYAMAGASLADGAGLRIRGEDYEFGPVYPTVLAVVLAVVPDREIAYPLFKAANALLFALAAIPIYLLARRLLRPWWGVGVAAMSIAIPSSMYISVVMTESASYLTYSVAVLAIVLSLERPSAARQAGAVAAIGLAFATRAQFGLLFAAYLAALVVLWALATERPGAKVALARLWPTLGLLALGLFVAVTLPLLAGSSPAESLGAYSVLSRSYDPLEVARWGVYHAADLELYLFVVPFAVAPIVLARLWRRARAGSVHDGAFIAAFLTINGGMLLVTSAFASTEFGFDRLHDRNLFYLAPLWLVVLAVWLSDGLPRPVLATGIGVGLSLALPLILPFGKIADEVGVDVVPSALWGNVRDHVGSEGLNGRHVLVLVVVALVVAVVLLPRRLRWVLPAAILVGFVATAALAWERQASAPEDAVFAGAASNRSWVDDALPDGARVTKLYLATTSCPASALTWHSLLLTEFFNSDVARAYRVGETIGDELPSQKVTVRADGRFVDESGNGLAADYVVTQPGIELHGSKLASGTAAGLVIWRIGGPVRALEARSVAELRTADCSTTAS